MHNTTTLPKHLVADVDPMGPAKVHRPQVRKQPFSRTAAEAAREDGVDTTVRVSNLSHGAPVDSTGVCDCGTPVTRVSHPALGPRPKWIHDHATGSCSAVMNVHRVRLAV